MRKFKVTLERTQSGKELDWGNEIVMESWVPPRIGFISALLTDPPILEKIIKVEEIKKQNLKICRKII